WTGVDLAEFEPDEPLRYVESDANRSALASFTTADPDRTWTPRELGRWIGLGGRGPVVTGSPSEVADELERWVEEADVDGFNLAYVTNPGTFVDFARLVTPELRKRPGGKGPRLAGEHPGARDRRAAAVDGARSAN